MNRGKSWKMALLTILGSVTLTVAALEGVFRLFFPQPLGASYSSWSSVPVHTPNYEFTNKTGEFQIRTRFNSMGLRDREYSKEKPTGSFRILVLGDSTTAALEVADSEVYTEILEASLNTPTSATRYEVINAGVSGFGTGDQLRMYEYLGSSLGPDLVMIQFSLINDLSENLFCRWYHVEQGEVFPGGFGDSKGSFPIVEFLGSHSHLAQFARMRAYRLFGNRAERLAAIERHKQRFHPLLYRNVGSATEFTADWEVTLAYLKTIRDRARKDGALTFLVVRPLDPDVDGTRSSKYPRDILEVFCRDQGIEHLDLTPSFREKSGGNIYRYRFREDSHWTPLGHRWAAEEILPRLRMILSQQAPEGSLEPVGQGMASP
ncbi:MAG: hypothetical protein GHCLOJNM_03287 [bacterium]|nr:hypothetical protein [bacterium]